MFLVSLYNSDSAQGILNRGVQRKMDTLERGHKLVGIVRPHSIGKKVRRYMNEITLVKNHIPAVSVTKNSQPMEAVKDMKSSQR